MNGFTDYTVSADGKFKKLDVDSLNAKLLKDPVVLLNPSSWTIAVLAPQSIIDFTLDVLQCIAQFLDVRNVGSLMASCKSLYKSLNTPQFWKSILQREIKQGTIFGFL